MLLPLSEKEAASLRAFLEANADCEAQAENEYVADLYDLEAPMTLDLVFVKGGVRVDGACLLAYDEEMEGYYIGEPVLEMETVRRALMEAGAFA
ncbi:MAG TPA: hypothetical protein IAB20_08800 [Candidatus Pullichristensenella excrementipullorum]|nr:hypothetical protein [Candidatus Pullichristensenella excrementipullorum]